MAHHYDHYAAEEWAAHGETRFSKIRIDKHKHHTVRPPHDRQPDRQHRKIFHGKNREPEVQGDVVPDYK